MCLGVKKNDFRLIINFFCNLISQKCCKYEINHFFCSEFAEHHERCFNVWAQVKFEVFLMRSL